MKKEVQCFICGKTFLREVGELSRNEKLGRKIYCSLRCAGKDNYKHLGGGRPENLKVRTPDEYSPFRWHYRNIIRRNNKECGVTLIDLKEQWEKQKGVCPYTGWQLKNLPTIGSKLPRTPDRASLDRIDSGKGYIKGNIQFVALIAQLAKFEWPENNLVEFCKAVSSYLTFP